MATAGRWATTSTVVVADDGAALLVDPALTRAEIEALGRTVRARGWRVAAGFATHAHFDHLLWSAHLGPVPRYATAACRDRAGLDAALLRAEAVAELPGPTPEVRTDLVALTGGAVPWPGPETRVVEHRGHAAGHAALWLPRAGALLVGDMLSDSEVPLLDLTAADPVADYRRALDLLQGYVDRAAVVVPGHGRVADRAEAQRRLTADRAYLDALAARDRLTAREDPRLGDPEMCRQHRDQVRATRP